MTATETILAGVTTRRRAQEQKDRDSYAALVERLAADAPAEEDTAAKVGELLERLGLDEQRLRADIARVQTLETIKAVASSAPALEAEMEHCGQVVTAAAERLRQVEETARREKAAAAFAYSQASRKYEEAARAGRKLLDFCDPEMVARYDEARHARGPVEQQLFRINAAKTDGADARGNTIVLPDERATMDLSDARVERLERERATALEAEAAAFAAMVASARVPLFPEADETEADEPGSEVTT